jgi:hypothetical protein
MVDATLAIQLYLHTGVPGFQGPTGVCLHRYYGGNPMASFGGVCLPQVNKEDSIELEFPYELRNPFFTPDTVPLGLTTTSHLDFIRKLEGFCRSACVCKSKQQYDEEENTSYGLALAKQGDHSKMIYETFLRYGVRTAFQLDVSQSVGQQGRTLFPVMRGS